MATDDKALAAIIDLINSLEQEAIDAKRTLNRMLVRDGQPARYAESELSRDGAANAAQIGRDRYYKKSLAPSIKDYLQLRKVSDADRAPAPLDDIYDALVRGGFKFETDNLENRKRGVRQSLTKNTTMFHKLPHGDFALVEWYPNLKIDEPAAPRKKKRRNGAKVSVATNRKSKPPTPIAEKPLPAPTGEAMTMLGAVRSAIDAMKGEFTKQDVLDWIVKTHPELRAQDRKTSVDSMVAKLKNELGLVVAFQGKGKEPHKFRREVK